MNVRTRGAIDDSLIHPLAILFIGMILVPMLLAQAGRLVGQSIGLDMADPFVSTGLTIGVVIIQGVVLVGLTLRHATTPAGLGLPATSLGLSTHHFWREVRVGIMWGMLLLLANVITSQLSQAVFRRIMGEEQFRAQLTLEGAQFVELVSSGLPTWLIILFAFSSVIVAPIAEELFFRGYVHAVFRSRVPNHALFLSSALFAFVHFYVIHLIPVFVIGLLLAVLYERRGSLTAPIVAHSFSNLVVTATMIVQGLLQAAGA